MKRLIKQLAGAGMLGLGLPGLALGAGTWGIGYGVPYANLGANIDYRVTPELYVTGGLGTGYNNVGYAVGGRYFLKPYSERVQPRVTLLYGVYGGLTPQRIDQQGNSVNRDSEDFNGFALGFGMQWMDDVEGFDFDVLLVDTRALRSREDDLSDKGYELNRTGMETLGVAIGYRRRF